MEKRHSLNLPYLCVILLLSFSANTSWAESFTAKVKVTLIDPANITHEQYLKFGPVKRLPEGTCTLNPENGQLEGNACTTQNTQTPVININGQENLNISIRLSESSINEIHFKPSLFNGQNQKSEFTLSAKQQAINLGGTLTQTYLAQEQGTTELSYNVEVIYP